jgi:glucokinase
MAPENAQFLSVGIDFGGTNLRIAVYTPETEILSSIAMPTRLEAGPMAVIDDMCNAVKQLLELHGEGREFVGVGVGSPGPLELPAGRLHAPPNLPGWDGFNLLEEMTKRLHVPILIEGDANVAALAEFVLGSGRSKGVDSLCMLTLGTGVGSGLILDGKLWHGATGMGGEAGHITIDPDGPLCGCGNHGCLEALASATALTNYAEKLIAEGKADGLQRLKSEQGSLSAFDIAQAAQQGDEGALAVYAKTGRALGIGIADLINILNLPLYVIGGGVVNSWDLLAPHIFAEIESRSYVYALTAPGRAAASGVSCGGTLVLPAELGSDAGLLGACILPLHGLKSRRASA